MQRPTAVALLGAAVLLVLTGCAGGDADADPRSTLDYYLGAAWGGDLGTPEQREQLQRESERRDQLVAQCMTAAGFDYVAPGAVGDAGAPAAAAAAYEPDSRDWVRQYGYGIVTSPGQADAVSPTGQAVDPNEDYVAGLDDERRAQYYAALYGGGEGEGAAGGCHDWAQQELEGDNPLTSGEHAELIEAVNGFYADLQTVPELVELNAQWAACMTGSGYAGFSVQRDAETSIAEAVAEYYGRQTAWEPDDPQLAVLADEEAALALADLDCREETDFRAREATVTATWEKTFVAEHREQLEAFKADAEAVG
ncbi:hypothetical protein H9651_05200 [Microbacterium sp. Sa4CUA7]|uniref:Uncharacterized protein n=1 Tax=Microbacterium pullorum TaxID=2762236 RepID=A0ABR8S0P0_9MICO|nr:hypothetical protein [Microbacterium pullorum]MBD7957023.1 hypothetical protein [Microbacterium pullorum]